jgi:predicted lipoprotein with Yx(FWY)xxD motif
MKRILFAVIPLVMLMVAALPARTSAEEEYALGVANDPNLGAILTGANGMTVYLFTPDTTAGKSNCAADCATSWPPVPATDSMELPDGVPGKLTAITRDDGSKQLAYNDIPLYYFVGDKAKGDVAGQGIGGVWFVVAPGATLTTYPAAPGKGTPVPASTLKVGFKPEIGPFLTDAKGMTVYVYEKDTTAGQSTCTGQCATSWPPVPADTEMNLPAGIPGKLGAIKRDDGTMQLTYNDIPLYYFAGDKAAGDTNGQEKGDVWYIVPVGAKLGDPGHETQESPTASPEASAYNY